MGRGSYTASDWTKLKNSRGLVKNNPVAHVFPARTVSHAFDSRNVRMREARDNEDSQKSTPVILGFDVTASMGYLARELAVNAVNKTIQSLLKDKPIPDPQILCSAIGDSRCDQVPLQVTQFESDIRIISQLTDLYLEGGGGGNGGESYNLLWYFAAKHTAADCFEKRHKKGYLFTIGDDACHDILQVAEIRRVFADSAPYAYSNEELLRMAQENYHVFHIHIDSAGPRDNAIFSRWRVLLPGSATVIARKDIKYLSDLITAIIRVRAGEKNNEVLRSMDQQAAEVIAPSMALIEGGSADTGSDAMAGTGADAPHKKIISF